MFYSNICFKHIDGASAASEKCSSLWFTPCMMNVREAGLNTGLDMYEK